MNCLFCKIINGEIPAKKVYETETVLVFEDIAPLAPIHLLIIPKIHFSNINELDQNKAPVMADLFLAAQEVAKDKKISEQGYRLIINNGPAAGQEIFHLHLHLLAGQEKLGPMLAKNN
jgi:diadenosine tetraphosphate (Ap4A) HIT family hydrolase